MTDLEKFMSSSLGPAYSRFIELKEYEKFMIPLIGPPFQTFVIKMDGLANGKGVFIVNSMEEALKALEEIKVLKLKDQI